MTYKKFNDRVEEILYGGDYNPEQWPEEIWEEDMKLLKEANINEVTLNVFSWASIQPSEDEYDFRRLDKIMNLVRKNGLKVMLATSTAAHPPWMAHRHPDVLRTEFDGKKRKFGGRHNSCPNSPTYRKYAPLLAKKLAERYKDYDNIVAWHISNEYGGVCCCENCEKAFRLWLKDKYKTLDNLNYAWNTEFWGHHFYDWDEIVIPDLRSEFFAWNRTQFQGMSLDYFRFNSDSIFRNYQDEYREIKKITPDIPITTNLMGFYEDLDYRKWAKYMDFVSWDNYPSNECGPAEIAMSHDLMRGIHNGDSFVLMEQTPSVTNWLPYNALKRPGIMRLWSYQAMAHGADCIQFFQMRRTRGACEALHGAVIDHVGTNNTRVYREVKQLGLELHKLKGEILGSRLDSKVAIYFDWNNWYALRVSAGPSINIDYKNEILCYYRALFSEHIDVDIIGPSDPLDNYKILIAPMMFMSQDGYYDKVKKFVSDGGTFVATYLTGMIDENYLFKLGGYPGEYKEVLGLWVEESDALPEDKANSFIYDGTKYPAKLICDLTHLDKEDDCLSVYEEDFYKGMPVVSRHEFNKGKAYYIGTHSSSEFYRKLVHNLCVEQDIKPIIDISALDDPEQIEVTARENYNGKFIFVLNHSDKDIEISLPQNGTVLLSEEHIENGHRIKIKAHDLLIYKV
ncbi:MAG: beta-galactosidase [Lachnospiraceae bacterium]|nr:beta-galactosidase [Lachnospiraceae bacterium]